MLEHSPVNEAPAFDAARSQPSRRSAGTGDHQRLRALLRTGSAPRQRERLHEKASAWFKARGLDDQAIDDAFAAADVAAIMHLLQMLGADAPTGNGTADFVGHLVTCLGGEQRAPRPGRQPDALNRMERDVLRLVSLGRTNREIADKLGITLGTTKWYVCELFGKLQVRNRTEASLRAREHALV